jgi:hypothetical protein
MGIKPDSSMQGTASGGSGLQGYWLFNDGLEQRKKKAAMKEAENPPIWVPFPGECCRESTTLNNMRVEKSQGI